MGARLSAEEIRQVLNEELALTFSFPCAGSTVTESTFARCMLETADGSMVGSHGCMEVVIQVVMKAGAAGELLPGSPALPPTQIRVPCSIPGMMLSDVPSLSRLDCFWDELGHTSEMERFLSDVLLIGTGGGSLAARGGQPSDADIPRTPTYRAAPAGTVLNRELLLDVLHRLYEEPTLRRLWTAKQRARTAGSPRSDALPVEDGHSSAAVSGEEGKERSGEEDVLAGDGAGGADSGRHHAAEDGDDVHRTVLAVIAEVVEAVALTVADVDAADGSEDASSPPSAARRKQSNSAALRSGWFSSMASPIASTDEGSDDGAQMRKEPIFSESDYDSDGSLDSIVGELEAAAGGGGERDGADDGADGMDDPLVGAPVTLELASTVRPAVLQAEELQCQAGRHPNIVQLLAAVDSRHAFFLVQQYHAFTLTSLLKFNTHVMGGDQHLTVRFLFYQLLQALHHCHSAGLVHGNLRPRNIFLTPQLWLRLGGFSMLPRLYRQPSPLPEAGGGALKPLVARWTMGEISNFDYLMALNHAAGRTMVDGTFHPVLPWVTDFSEPGAGWRDLSKSKFRLNKGDRQLQTTYLNSPKPHHITESLSEITYYIYMARRTPIAVLRKIVRSNFEAKEYPSSMPRMYEWTPDECIPEFFTEPDVFSSLHRDLMPDIELPHWCATAEEFIAYHRGMLESEQVSRHLHHWIDITFGYKLTGPAAVEAMNVVLPIQIHDKRRLVKSPGFVQLFSNPHPPRYFAASPASAAVPPASPAATAASRLPTTAAGSVSSPLSAAAFPPAAPSASTMAALSPDAGALESKSDERPAASPVLPPLSPPSARAAAASPPFGSPVLASASGSSSSTVSSDGSVAHLGITASSSSSSLLGGDDDAPSLPSPASSAASAGLRPLAAAGGHGMGSLPSISLAGMLPDDVDGRLQHMETVDAFSRSIGALLEPVYGVPQPTRSPADDMWSAGCILAEMCLGKPLFSPRTLHAYWSSQLPLQRVVPQLRRLPAVLRRTVTALLNRDAAARPSAHALLTAEPLKSIAARASPLLRPLLPSYLHKLHSWLAAYHATKDEQQRLEETERALPSLLALPSDGFALCLPFIRALFSSSENTVLIGALKLLQPVGAKMGRSAVNYELLPTVVRLMDRTDDPALLRAMLSFSVLQGLLRNAGSSAFIQHVLPLVMEQLVRTAAHHSVRAVASQSTARLADGEALGPALALRYILPELLNRLGRMRRAGRSESADRSKAGADMKPHARSVSMAIPSSSLPALLDPDEVKRGGGFLSVRGSRPGGAGVGSSRRSGGAHAALGGADFLHRRARSEMPKDDVQPSSALSDAVVGLCNHLPQQALTMYVLPQLVESLQSLVRVGISPTSRSPLLRVLDALSGVLALMSKEALMEELAGRPLMNPARLLASLPPIKARDFDVQLRVASMVAPLCKQLGAVTTREKMLVHVNAYFASFNRHYVDTLIGASLSRASLQLAAAIYMPLLDQLGTGALEEGLPNVKPLLRERMGAYSRGDMSDSDDDFSKDGVGDEALAALLEAPETTPKRRVGRHKRSTVSALQETVISLLPGEEMLVVEELDTPKRELSSDGAGHASTSSFGSVEEHPSDDESSSVPPSRTSSVSAVSRVVRSGLAALTDSVSAAVGLDAPKKASAADADASGSGGAADGGSSGRQGSGGGAGSSSAAGGSSASGTADELMDGALGSGWDIEDLLYVHPGTEVFIESDTDSEEEELALTAAGSGSLGAGGRLTSTFASMDDDDDDGLDEVLGDSADASAADDSLWGTMGAVGQMVVSGARRSVFSWGSSKTASEAAKRKQRRSVWLFGSPDRDRRPQVGPWLPRMAVQEREESHLAAVSALVTDEAERLIFTGGRDKEVKLWTIGGDSLQQIASYTGHKRAVVQVLPIVGSAVAVSNDGHLHMWDVASCRRVWQSRSREGIVAVAQLPAAVGLGSGCAGEQPMLAGITRNGRLLQWDCRLPSTSPVADWRLTVAGGVEDGSLFSKASAAVAVGSSSVVGISSSSSSGSGGGSGGSGGSSGGGGSGVDSPRCLAWDEAGRWLAVGGDSGFVQVLDAQTGQPLRHWKAHDGAVVAVHALSSDDVLTVGQDGKAKLWQLSRDAERVPGRAVRLLPAPALRSFVSGLPPASEGAVCHSYAHEHMLVTHERATVAVAELSKRDDAREVRARELAVRTEFGSKRRALRSAVTSLAMLPLRRLVLLGCEDGSLLAAV